MFVLTPDEQNRLRTIANKEIGLKNSILTENAGRTAFSVLIDEFELPIDRAVVVIGKGYNGAEGLVVARYLLEKTRDLSVFIVGKRGHLNKEAKTNLKLFEKVGGEVIEITTPDINIRNKFLRANLIVDAIWGTGFKGIPEGIYRNIIGWINESRAYTLSIDIPSGVNPATGEVSIDAVYADLTVTMIFPKIGNIFYPGKLHTGKLVIADTGIPEKIVSREVKRATFEEEDAAKYIITGNPNGRVLFIGDLEESILTANAAIRIGAGTSYIALPQKFLNSISPVSPNVVELPVVAKGSTLTEESADYICNYGLDFKTLVINPGAHGKILKSQGFLRLIKKFRGTILLDSPGESLLGIHLNCLRNRENPSILMLTMGEFKKLLMRLEDGTEFEIINAGVKFSTYNNIVLVIKSTPAVIFSPDGFTWINSTGTPGLASGDTGKVLTGMIAGLLTQGYSPPNASTLAVFLHGLAADIGVIDLTKHTLIAGDLIEYIPEAIRYLKDYEDLDKN